mgnify:CR=1 FL=1
MQRSPLRYCFVLALLLIGCGTEEAPIELAPPKPKGWPLRLLDEPLVLEASSSRDTRFDPLLLEDTVWVRSESVAPESWRSDLQVSGADSIHVRLPIHGSALVHPARQHIGEEDMDEFSGGSFLPDSGEFILSERKIYRKRGEGPEGTITVDYPTPSTEMEFNSSLITTDGQVLASELRLGSDCRRAAMAPAPHKFVYQVELPESAHFDFAVGVRPHEIKVREDGIELRNRVNPTLFSVTLELEDGTVERVWKHLLRGAESPTGSNNRPWRWYKEFSLDLSRWSNQTVRLHLSAADGNKDPDQDWQAVAAWAEPLIWSAKPLERPNILLMVLDTLRADRLGCYGYERARTPNLDALAAKGVLFEDAMSAASWTLPSHASLFTSTFPSQHGLWDNQRLPDALDTVAELLSRNRYRTASFSERGFLSEVHGFARGFERFDSQSRDCTATYRLAYEWIKKQEMPFFSFVHTYKVHSPYAPAPEFAEGYVREYSGDLPESVDVPKYTWGLGNGPEPKPEDIQYISDLYDAEIAELDFAVGQFLDELEKAGKLENTLLIITSDHGEEFFEHGAFLHGLSLYQEQLHIPMIAYWKGHLEGGQRIGHTVHMVDVAPTLAQAAQVEFPESWMGTPLSSSAPDAGRPLFVPMKVHFSKSTAGNDCVALREGDMIYIEYTGDRRAHDKHKGPLLFDLATDPGETTNLINSETEDAWKAKVESTHERHGQIGTTKAFRRSQESVKELEKLGYAGGGDDDE